MLAWLFIALFQAASGDPNAAAASTVAPAENTAPADPLAAPFACQPTTNYRHEEIWQCTFGAVRRTCTGQPIDTSDVSFTARCDNATNFTHIRHDEDGYHHNPNDKGLDPIACVEQTAQPHSWPWRCTMGPYTLHCSHSADRQGVDSIDCVERAPLNDRGLAARNAVEHMANGSRPF